MNLSRSGLLLLALSAAATARATGQQPAPYVDTLPGSLVTFEMVPVAGGSVTFDTPAGVVNTMVAPFWIGATEVTWELYDIFAFRLDLPREQRATADASARPSRPYGAPDRGFGHAGYPAISMTHTAAVEFAAWLSRRTGRDYRVATEAQWMRAAEVAGAVGLNSDAIRRVAWSADDAGSSTHPVATRDGTARIHDMLGNAGEWVTAPDGAAVIRGGSYLDPSSALATIPRAVQQPSWNMTDPQIPKSRWWLSDATFTGFRIVRVP